MFRRILKASVIFGLDKYEERQQKKVNKLIARMDDPLPLQKKKQKGLVQIHVSNVENGASWLREIHRDQLQNIEQKMISAKVVGVFPALLRPVRSDSAKNFAKDFFLPTTLNYGLKIRSMAVRVFAVIGAFVFDLLTLPIRLLTCIPTVLTNSAPDKHPLYQYLKAQNVDRQLLKSGHVQVRIMAKDQVRTLNVNFFVQPAYPAYYSYNATHWQ
jgi:hypothetical protein